MYTPNSEVRFLHIPIEMDMKNQLTFNNKEEQAKYFASHEVARYEKVNYIRKNSIIRLNKNVDDCYNFNYVMYRNTDYTNKWFYAFVTNVEFITRGNTAVQIATDPWQTWQFDIKYYQSFVKREMCNVSDDYPGFNLIPEGLETGEYKIGGTAEFDNLDPVWVVAYLGNTWNSNGTDIPIGDGGYIANGIAQCVTFIICTTLDAYNSIIGQLQSDENRSQYILSCFSVPRLAVQDYLNSSTAILGIDNAYVYIQGNTYNQAPVQKTLISLPDNLDGYIPVNQKLRTYPYIYVGFNPVNGQSKIYRYENFTNNTPVFNIISEINPNPSIYFIPQKYRGANGDSMSDIASVSGYPTLSSRNDYFNSWLATSMPTMKNNLAQTQSSYNVNRLGTGIQGALGVASTIGNMVNSSQKENTTGMDMANAVTGLVSNSLSAAQNIVNQDINYEYHVKGMLAQIETQQMLPDNANLSTSNATLIGYNLFDKNIFSRYTIKNQFARRIDKYFNMYGYETDELKIPNLNNRPNWNYVQTIGINITAPIPQLDLLQIKAMFNDGVTLWHNPNTFGDYSQNNR
jgi:hypothetical protein